MLPDRLILKDFLEAKPEEYLFIVDNLLPRGGLSILGGNPKAGKSTFLRTMLKSIARGSTFLNRETTKTPIIYYALEEIPHNIAHEFRLLGCKDEEIYIRAGPMNKPMIAKVLENDIMELSAGFAVIDPLFDALGVTDSNAYAMNNDAMKELLVVARNTNCHILAIHHSNKSEARRGNSFLGSQALAGATECNLFLTVNSKDQRMLSSDQRSGAPFEDLILNYNAETHDITAMEPMSILRAREAQSRMLAALEDQELTTSDWLSRCKGRREANLMAIHALEEMGTIVKRTEGKRSLWRQV